MMAATSDANLFAVIIKCTLLLLSVMSLGGFVFFSSGAGLGVMVGGGIALINFIWMRNMLQRIIFHTPANPERYAQLRFIARLSVIAVALYSIINYGLFPIAGIIAGLSVVVISLSGLSIYLALRTGG